MPFSLYRALRAHPAVAACAAVFILGMPTADSHAALTLSNTRIIHQSDNRSTSVVVRNPSQQTYAVQAWINTEADDNVSVVPLLPAPALFRLVPGNEQLLQINALPNTLAEDRESLFFLNVQEIPQAVPGQGNALNIALRTRLKLFYRPHQLKGTPATEAKNLQFSLRMVAGEAHLRVHNPSPFHITFSQLNLADPQQSARVKNPAMLAPFSGEDYVVKGIQPSSQLQAEFGVINDFGGFTPLLKQPVAATR
ncbi:molecular chaperone [Pseudomonas sp. SWRI59]|uniref:fimbrial biogenesis chaperone n=1 Tax=Pseudomonas TaxID=286 RepID=UPI0016446640|nr:MULTISPECIES: molecular chaperone [unclassified Pseudomonas]MBC3500398.1 molecular chaperone [Pseudomonas sp. SWRI59]MBC3507932.1 molecular chaperone [Pseudomonas sp. SWRI68]UVL05309.1 molecular chaperone [Pseudomonas sp. B21-047]